MRRLKRGGLLLASFSIYYYLWGPVSIYVWLICCPISSKNFYFYTYEYVMTNTYRVLKIPRPIGLYPVTTADRAKTVGHPVL